MFGFEFANPKYFLLLILLVPMIVWYILKEKKSHADLQFSSLQAFKGIKHSGRIWWRHVLFVLELLAIILLVTALARPQSSNSWQTYTSEGIDIALALDVSTSMLARDFTPDRLEAAKEVATKFILERPQDKIGLVVFAGESFTQCPLTTDQAVLVNLLREVKSGMIQDGTAIGLGLANAVNRLKDSPGKSKVVILLTDGINNQGAIAPVTAAGLAKAFGIRGYTILPEPVTCETELISLIHKKTPFKAGGVLYNKTTKEKIGKINKLLVYSFWVYNKSGELVKRHGRNKKMEEANESSQIPQKRRVPSEICTMRAPSPM